jgi:D-alanyl-D-alanine carboxypeptidase
MTCFLALIIADKFCIDIKKEKIIVSERASKMGGTSAKLAYSDVLTVYEMMHALMLPSGNDAAIALG